MAIKENLQRQRQEFEQKRGDHSARAPKGAEEVSQDTESIQDEEKHAKRDGGG